MADYVDVYADGVMEGEMIGSNVRLVYFRWERDDRGNTIQVPVIAVVRPQESMQTCFGCNSRPFPLVELMRSAGKDLLTAH